VGCSRRTRPRRGRLCADIYGHYQIYHQAAGHEQKARSSAGGELLPRSELIAGFLRCAGELPSDGGVLDIGCGNGAFLRAMHKLFPNWSVTGSDLNDSFREDIRAIGPRASFQRKDELTASRDTYDVLSLIHCLEHISAPVTYLANARRHLEPTGLLLIEVPDGEVNPLDLVVADYASHFSKTTLSAIVEAAGYHVLACGNLVVGKEITLLARPLHEKPVSRVPAPHAKGPAIARRNLAWLNQTLKLGPRLAS
jgi:2-polyprenyl-3-methyl-5-hydroxy-6-metoxy-1,4-benzoquinol methylase